MHSCLTLSNVGGNWYVERQISGLISGLNAFCDSIHSCDINVEGPSGTGDARCWRIGVKVRVYEETIRASANAPEGADPAQSLARALRDVYTKATGQMAHVAQRHHSCCSRCA